MTLIDVRQRLTYNGFLRKMLYFVVAQRLEYLGATAPLRTVYFAFSRLELKHFPLKNPFFRALPCGAFFLRNLA
jgi:hypothetical protein